MLASAMGEKGHLSIVLDGGRYIVSRGHHLAQGVRDLIEKYRRRAKFLLEGWGRAFVWCGSWAARSSCARHLALQLPCVPRGPRQPKLTQREAHEVFGHVQYRSW